MKLGEIAATLGLTISGDDDLEIHGAAGLDEAGPGQITFVQDAKTAKALKESKASAVIVAKQIKPDRPALLAQDPKLAFAKVIELLHPEPEDLPGIDGSAMIGQGVAIGDDVHIGAHVSVGNGCIIGDKVSIHAGARIGPGCSIGRDTKIFPNVVVYENCEIGARVRVHGNSVIGSDGFGYIRLESGENYKIPQRGIVRLEDDVEIGAGSTVDRATTGVTLIKRGVKIDNQVQIGHNCEIGANTVIAGCSGTAGSVTIGDGVMIGGMVAVSDHLKVASGTMIAGNSGVYKDIDEPGIYAGPWAMKLTKFKRSLLLGKRLDKINARLKVAEARINEIEKD